MRRGRKKGHTLHISVCLPVVGLCFIQLTALYSVLFSLSLSPALGDSSKMALFSLLLFLSHRAVLCLSVWSLDFHLYLSAGCVPSGGENVYPLRMPLHNCRFTVLVGRTPRRHGRHTH